MGQIMIMMNKPGLIAPSIAAADLGKLSAEIQNLHEAGVDLIHVDIMDGVFVPNLSFGPWIIDVIRKVSDLPIDCHLMVSRPADWILPVASAGADTITIHVESTPHIHRHIESIRKLGKKAGVSFNPGNPVSLIEPCLDWVDSVQVMGVDPGFSENTIEKIQSLYSLRQSRDYLIKVDGGIRIENIERVREAGADVFVLGSSIFSHPDKKKFLRDLKDKLT
jgi:ribulose-phosphate 3-epimerase